MVSKIVKHDGIDFHGDTTRGQFSAHKGSSVVARGSFKKDGSVFVEASSLPMGPGWYEAIVDCMTPPLQIVTQGPPDPIPTPPELLGAPADNSVD